MNLLFFGLLFFSANLFANPTLSAAPAGKKIHKEIKSGQVIIPTPPQMPAPPISADKSKAKLKK